MAPEDTFPALEATYVLKDVVQALFSSLHLSRLVHYAWFTLEVVLDHMHFHFLCEVDDPDCGKLPIGLRNDCKIQLDPRLHRFGNRAGARQIIQVLVEQCLLDLLLGKASTFMTQSTTHLIIPYDGSSKMGKSNVLSGPGDIGRKCECQTTLSGPFHAMHDHTGWIMGGGGEHIYIHIYYIYIHTHMCTAMWVYNCRCMCMFMDHDCKHTHVHVYACTHT